MTTIHLAPVGVQYAIERTYEGKAIGTGKVLGAPVEAFCGTSLAGGMKTIMLWDHEATCGECLKRLPERRSTTDYVIPVMLKKETHA
jgi:hypothetical protein